jgi:hypothetical protein
MPSAASIITIQIVSVSQATLGILSHTVLFRQLSPLAKQKLLILVILLHVDPMPFVRTETELLDVNVSLNTLEIPMLPAGLSVWFTQTVHLTEHAKETSVLIHVREHVESMLFAV